MFFIQPQTASMEPVAVVPEDQEREVEREGVEGEGEVRGGSGSEGVRGDTVEETVRGDGEGVIGGGVEEMVEEVRGEVERVAGEVREKKVREVQEAQMADQHLNWLKDSAQVSLFSHTQNLLYMLYIISTTLWSPLG